MSVTAAAVAKAFGFKVRSNLQAEAWCAPSGICKPCCLRKLRCGWVGIHTLHCHVVHSESFDVHVPARQASHYTRYEPA